MLIIVWEVKEIINQKLFFKFNIAILSSRYTFSFYDILAIFQNYINKILTKKLDIIVIIYLNNILVYIKDPILI